MPTSWAWDFVRRRDLGPRNPAHVYTLPGNFTVKLTAGNAGG